MNQFTHDLPNGTTEWVANTGGGEITRLYRHVARREAWVVDVTRPDGSVLEGFLRLQRHLEGEDPDPQRLEREIRIMQALGERGIPEPAVYGWNADLRAALLQRDPGRADIDKLDDPAQQRAVMEDFIRVVARMHSFEPASLGLDDVMQYMPETPRECALKEVELIVSQWQPFLDDYVDPLTSYGLDWLYRFAPDEVARISLLQGDTGPVNFMFQGDQVSSMIDWELGHYGDPLEDLGNIAVREFWNPSGGLKGLFELYEQESGIRYDRFRTQYYAVHQNVRGMIPIHRVCNSVPKHESLAWYLCYRYVGDRSTVEMLAQAMNVEIERPELPLESKSDDPLAGAAMYSQQHDVLPRLEDKFGAARANDISRLIDCMDRRRRYGDGLIAAELDDLAQLLGKRPATLEEGLKDFVGLIRKGGFDDAAVIRTLARKAYRDEWLYMPVVALYPERKWSELD